MSTATDAPVALLADVIGGNHGGRAEIMESVSSRKWYEVGPADPIAATLIKNR